uniref:peroxidase n=1 Tax=Quercus lobata TaxID=97700 RepID=A0A7N2L3K8_QUELO
MVGSTIPFSSFPPFPCPNQIVFIHSLQYWGFSYLGCSLTMVTIKFCLVFFVTMSMMLSMSLAMPSLKVDNYQSTCPSAESIVRNTVNNAMSSKPGLAADLTRMHFHDCFVRCIYYYIYTTKLPDDGLSQCTVTSLVEVETEMMGSNKRGKKNKKSYVVQAPYVSCWLKVLWDLFLYFEEEPIQNLPPPTFNAQQLEQRFAQKGLSLDEMGTLSGTHSIGRSHYSSFSKRLYTFNETNPQDPSMDPIFARDLKSKCPQNAGNDDPTVLT